MGCPEAVNRITPICAESVVTSTGIWGVSDRVERFPVAERLSVLDKLSEEEITVQLFLRLRISIKTSLHSPRTEIISTEHFSPKSRNASSMSKSGEALITTKGESCNNDGSNLVTLGEQSSIATLFCLGYLFGRDQYRSDRSDRWIPHLSSDRLRIVRLYWL